MYKLIAIALCLLTTQVLAKTLYVDQMANTIGPDCTKNAPCSDVTEALDLAGNGDRIVVSPGYYQGPFVVGPSNIKLESVAGPHSTFLISDGAYVVDVFGDKVSIGKKGKGFGIWRDSESATNATVMIRSEADTIKIEGNHFWPFDYTYDSTQSGPIVELNGTDKATIRHNFFDAGKVGIMITSDARANHIIDNNRFRNIQGDCVFVTAEQGGNAKIRKNWMNACREEEGASRDGVSHGIVVDYLTSSGKATIQDNNIMRTPIGINVAGAAHLVQRNQITFGAIGFSVQTADRVQIKDNTGHFLNRGFFLNAGATNTTVSGNRIHANEIIYHVREGSTSFRSFSKNHLARRTSSGSGPGPLCPIYLEGASYPDGIAFSKNLWGAFADVDGAPNLDTYPECDSTNAETVYNAGEISFDPGANELPIKAKHKSPL